MGSVELTVTSAKDLKNVNWRNGPLSPYVVVWLDPNNKCSTRVDREGDSFPVWDQTLSIPLPPGPTDDAFLYLDVVHAGSESGTKPLIGSAKLRLRDVIDDVGYGERTKRSLQLKRPSGRPHGKVEVKISVRELPRYRSADPYYVPPPAYGVQPRDALPQQYGYQYSSQPKDSYYSNAPPPPAGYPSSYGSAAAAPPPAYGQQGYGNARDSYGAQGYGNVQSSYGQQSYGGAQGSYGQPVADQKKSKFGMGTGLAVGAVAGVLGGLALKEGIDHVEDNIAERAADKVEDDFYNDDNDDY
ncbi:hypothetical protein MLD38_025685 [Melastoma candidum]|uniref:Uncharacterized protein n=1 Tax=Melastoma candidum TaxID=119954 RepID=A0ACB9P1B2_9MYRT|nr:hypothetical protein MLD38_025685 [Melastoma candidum]